MYNYGYQQPPPYGYQPNGYGYMPQQPPNYPQQGSYLHKYFRIQTNFGKWILAYLIQSALISILSRQIGISHSNSLNALFNEFDRQKFLIGLQRSRENKQLILSLIFF